MRRSIGLAVALVVPLAATACVDHDANAAKFCRNVAPIVEATRDGEQIDKDEAKDVADTVAKTMRHAEDATRSVRGSARDLSEAYDELVDLLGDDDATANELADTRAELRQARRDVRAACADIA